MTWQAPDMYSTHACMPCHALTWQAPDMYSMHAMSCHDMTSPRHVFHACHDMAIPNITGHDKPCSPWMPYHERPSKAPHLMTYLSKPPPPPSIKKVVASILTNFFISYIPLFNTTLVPNKITTWRHWNDGNFWIRDIIPKWSPLSAGNHYDSARWFIKLPHENPEGVFFWGP